MTQPGLVAQLVERLCSNPEVVSSNPAGVKDFSLILLLISDFLPLRPVAGGKLWRAVLLTSCTHTYTLHHNYEVHNDREFMPAFKLKLASTFVLRLVEEMLTPLNSLYFSTQLSLKILAKQSKTAKKMLPFHC